MSPERELEFLRLIDALPARLKPVSDVQKSLATALRLAREFFRADRGCAAVARPGEPLAEVLTAFPPRGDWDRALLTGFIRNEHPAIPPSMLLAPVRRRGRAWGVLALERTGEASPRGDGRLLSRVSALVSEAVERIDRERMFEVRDRIDRKIMEQLRPKDLFYQILDGLRSLTRYDHSSAILMQEEEGDALILVAEQIAWKKGKSRRIGWRLPLTPELRKILAEETVHGFERRGDEWREWSGRPVAALAALLDYNREDAPNPAGGGTPGAPATAASAASAADLREAAMLVAPLAFPDGIFGVLKVASCHPGSFGAYDANLVERFRSQAAVAIQNSRRTESLHARMVEAEKKHAMADLARSVSHDVNNAMGSVIPLLQQIQADARDGRVDPAVLCGDLDQIETSLQVCRRIFSGMLSLARGSARPSRRAPVYPALDASLTILQDGLRHRGIDLAVDVPDDLPEVAGARSDLEQVFLNLISNAREAMPQGGRLSIAARRAGAGRLEIAIEDTGHGIPPENLPRVEEPFFTTKPQGTGLGLPICRSIVWEMGGRMEIKSESGRGTRVTITLPLAGEEGSARREGAAPDADPARRPDAARRGNAGEGA